MVRLDALYIGMNPQRILLPEGLSARTAELLYDLPIVAEPWAVLGEEGLRLVRRLLQDGVIREIGPVFNPHLLGYRTTLAAGKVPANRLDEVAGIISDHAGVSHNYLRDCDHFNLWFTLAVAGGEENLEKELKKLSERCRIPFQRFDAVKRYKISFQLSGKSLPTTSSPLRLDDFKPELRKKLAEAVEILQRGLSPVEQPYLELAKVRNFTEAELIERTKRLKESGMMRRVGVTWRHRELGLRENVLCVWQVPAEHMDAFGEKAAAIPMITHCYRRTILPDWPWPMYTMIHGRTMADCRAVIDDLQQAFPEAKSLAMRTVKEFKKTRIVYRVLPT